MPFPIEGFTVQAVFFASEEHTRWETRARDKPLRLMNSKAHNHPKNPKKDRHVPWSQRWWILRCNQKVVRITACAWEWPLAFSKLLVILNPSPCNQASVLLPQQTPRVALDLQSHNQLSSKRFERLKIVEEVICVSRLAINWSLQMPWVQEVCNYHSWCFTYQKSQTTEETGSW